MPEAPPVRFSLELFPPRTEAGTERLLETVDAYTNFRPSYLTVTFGAGGSGETADYTRRIVSSVSSRTNLPVAAHITFANRSKKDIDAIMDSFWRDGVRHVVALRGDMLAQGEPFRPHPEGYATTLEFIAALRAHYPDLTISVAGYPETHPESPTVDFDIEHLKRKIDAGADQVLTQFFFDPEVFLRWRDKVAAYGVTKPLVPGLLPIHNFPKMLSFAKKCNTNVPSFLHHMFINVDPASLDHKLLAMNVLSHQITRLIEAGVRDFHFYTLNETLLTRHICQWLRAAF
jgi:methylenetetrahydrofolate reductase (NADPH)